jgi:UDP-N-acetylglucosamine:LPS N-acetylglucosamine transferase
MTRRAIAGADLGSETPRRFLVLSASMGSGHDTVAAELTTRLRAARHEAHCADVLDLLPTGLGKGLRSGYRAVISHLPALYAGVYAAFFRDGAVPRPGSAPLAALAGDRLLDLVERDSCDVVVSVFHLAAQITGRLRARGELRVPSAVVMTEFAAHRQWLHAGNDLYVCHADEIATGIRRTLGRPAVGSGPLVASRFCGPSPPATALWRHRFAADGRPPVLLSTGAWGIGSRMAKTARLLDTAGYLPVVLCGENRRLYRGLAALPHVMALDWVEDMPGLMGACRALVDNAAGQTSLEALAAGLPVIGYRPIPGHGADGVCHMADLGLSDFARDPRELLRSLRVLTAPGPVRESRIADGRALFTAAGITPLETLGIRGQDLAKGAAR